MLELLYDLVDSLRGGFRCIKGPYRGRRLVRGIHKAKSRYVLLQDLHSVDLEEFKYGGTNITAFRLVDPEKPELQRVVRDWIYGEQRYGRKLDVGQNTNKVGMSLNKYGRKKIERNRRREAKKNISKPKKEARNFFFFLFQPLITEQNDFFFLHNLNSPVYSTRI